MNKSTKLIGILLTWGRLNCFLYSFFLDCYFWDGYFWLILLFFKWLFLKRLFPKWLLLRWLLLTSGPCKTPLSETGCLDSPYFLLYWLPKHPMFWFTPSTVSYAAYGYLPSLCSICVTYGTSCRAIGHQVLPIQPLPTEAEDLPKGERSFKHVPSFTYLIYLSPKVLC